MDLKKMDIRTIVVRYGKEVRKLSKAMRHGNLEDTSRQLIDDIQGKIEELKENLAPQRGDFDAQITRPTTFTLADNAWITLRDTIRQAADSAFEDLDKISLHPKPKTREEQEEQIANQQLRAAVCRRLLRLWMETRLYRLRMLTNFQYLTLSHRKNDFERENHRRGKEVSKIIQEYRKSLRAWDQRLKKHAKRHLLEYWFEDADHLALLSRAFGPSADMTGKEPGWAQLAYDAQAKLHFEAQETRRRTLEKYWNPGLVLEKFWLDIKRLCTAHNTQNWRLFVIPLIVVPIGAGFYWADDNMMSSCALAQPHPSWYGYFLYSLNNLTGTRHIDSIPCGPNIQTIATIEGLAGYVLLAVLASLIFEYLNKSKL